MAIDFTKLIASADGDWEYFMKAWNNDGDNIRNNDLVTEEQARRFVRKRAGKNPGEFGPSAVSGKNPTSLPEWIVNFWESGTSQNRKGEGEFFDIGEFLGRFVNERGGVRGPMDILGNIARAVPEEASLYLKQTSELLEEINTRTGMAGRLSADFRREIEMAQPFAISLGIAWKDLSEMVANTVEQSGKFKLLNTETINQMSLASKFIDDAKKIGDYARNFELIGLGVGDMSMHIQQAAKSSLEMGINGRTVTRQINDHIKELNAYGFRNGVEGLTRMAQKSVEFRMNMSEAFKFAKEVWDPDKALELVGNLQVLGGAFGDLNDPIKLMYMATNNVEGLQDAIIEASKSLVTFNDEQGRFEITGVNLRRASEMAKIMGVDYDQLANGAVAAMERVTASTELMSRGFNMNEEDKEFLINLSRMEGGQMVISIPENLQDQFQGTQVALSEMTSTQAKMILDQRAAFKDLSVEDYARQQVTALENLVRDVSFIRAAVRVSLGQKVGEALENYVGGLNTVLPEEMKNLRNTIYSSFEKANLTQGMLGGVSENEKIAGIAHLEAEKVAKEQARLNKSFQEEKTSTTTSKTETTPSKVVTESIITIRSWDNAIEPIKRELWSDQKFIGDVKRSYLESLNQEK